MPLDRHARALLLLTTALTAWPVLVAPALAASPQPTGGQVVAGSAAIAQGATLTAITQTSQRAAIDWQSFSVGAGQTVAVSQPNAQSMLLNRVVGPDPSVIAGRITANGGVAIVNQSGVVFTPGAQVDVQTLVASTANTTNHNFMAGKLAFDIPGKPGAKIVNAGTITVKEAGLAALVAPAVRNSGVIQARLGHVVLAGAEAATLDLYGDGLVSIDVTRQVTQLPTGRNGKPVSALVTNTGTILAEGGTVQLTAAAADGVVQNLIAAGGTISANGGHGAGGTIALNGVGGSLVIEGELSATGSTGGTIQAVADGTVAVAPGARINASGRKGGGTVALGSATTGNVAVAKGAVVKADATGSGNGGKVSVAARNNATIAGTVHARGGTAQGVTLEAGGTLTVAASARVDTSGDLAMASGDAVSSAPTLAVANPLISLDGRVVSAGNVTVRTGGGGVLAIGTGTLAAGGALNLAAGSLTQSGGLLLAGGSATIQTTGTLVQTAGTLAAGGTLAVNAAAISQGLGGTAPALMSGRTAVRLAATSGSILQGASATLASAGPFATGGGIVAAAPAGTVTVWNIEAAPAIAAGTVALPAATGPVDLALVGDSVAIAANAGAGAVLNAGTLWLDARRGITESAGTVIDALRLEASAGLAQPVLPPGVASPGWSAAAGSAIDLAGANRIGILGTVLASGNIALATTSTALVGPVEAGLGASTSASLDLAVSGELALVGTAGVASPGTATVTATDTLLANGGTLFAGSAVSIAAGTAYAQTGGEVIADAVTIAAPRMALDGGAILAPGSVAAAGIALAGTVTVDGGGVISAASAGGRIDLGTLVLAAGTVSSAGSLRAGAVNQQGGTIAVAGDAAIDRLAQQAGGLLAVGGDLTLGSGSGTAGALGSAATSGAVAIAGSVSAAGTLALWSPGTIQLAGTVLAGTLGATGGAIAQSAGTLAGSAAVALLATAADAAQNGGVLAGGAGGVAVRAPLGTVSFGNITLPGGTAPDVTLAGAAIAQAPGQTLAAATLAVYATRSIDQQGTVVANLLTGTAGLAQPGQGLTATDPAATAHFDGAANRIARLGDFTSTAVLRLTDAAPLTVPGSTVTAPLVRLNGAGTISLADGLFTVGGEAGLPPPGQAAIDPSNATYSDDSQRGLYLMFNSAAAVVSQSGLTQLRPIGSLPALMRIDLPAGTDNAVNLDPHTGTGYGLAGPTAAVFLHLAQGWASGNLNLGQLGVVYAAPPPHLTLLTGTLRDTGGATISGQTAASLAGIALADGSFTPNGAYQLNGCAIASNGCIQTAQDNVPVPSQLRPIDFGNAAGAREDADVLVPNVSDRDY